MLDIFSIIVLILSATVHEYMHDFAAYRLGDMTAKNSGRLTLNPLKHLDLVGSFLLPLSLILVHSPFVFGWAKPVPYNPYNLKDRKYGDAKVAIAGPLANLLVAVVFSLLVRFLNPASMMFYLASEVVIINLILMVFNLVPLPPLDGSKVLACFLPEKWRQKLLYMSSWTGLIIVLIFIFFLSDYLSPIVYWLFSLLTGVAV
jgi:Zn-dependent protease